MPPRKRKPALKSVPKTQQQPDAVTDKKVPQKPALTDREREIRAEYDVPHDITGPWADQFHEIALAVRVNDRFRAADLNLIAMAVRALRKEQALDIIAAKEFQNEEFSAMKKTAVLAERMAASARSTLHNLRADPQTRSAKKQKAANVTKDLGETQDAQDETAPDAAEGTHGGWGSLLGGS